MTTQDIVSALLMQLLDAKRRSRQSDEETAKILGVCQSTVSIRLRAPAGRIDAGVFIDFCRAYNADPLRLFTEALSEARRGAAG
jgi:predicted transcriptional regulator